MLQVPDRIKELINSDSIHKNFRVVFADGSIADICNDKIVNESVSFTESICSQEKFKLGLCESPTIEFEVVDIHNIKGKQISCFIEIYCESDVEGAVYRDDLSAYVYPIQLGVFIVDDCKKQADLSHRKIEAYGVQSALNWKPNIWELYRENNISSGTTYAVNLIQYLNSLVNSINDTLEEISLTEIDGDYIALENGDYFDGFTKNIDGNIVNLESRKCYFFDTVYKTAKFSIESGKEAEIKVEKFIDKDAINAELELKYAYYAEEYANMDKSNFYTLKEAIITNGQIPTDIQYFLIDNYDEIFKDENNNLEQLYNDFVFNFDTVWIPRLREIEKSYDHSIFKTRLMDDYHLVDYLYNNFSLYVFYANGYVPDMYIPFNYGKNYTNEYDAIVLNVKLTDSSSFRTITINVPSFMNELFETMFENWEPQNVVSKVFSKIKNIVSSSEITMQVQSFEGVKSAINNLDNQKLVEDYCELQGKVGRFMRDGSFKMLSFDQNFGLFPSNTLYPEDTLYPSESNVGIISKSQYLEAWYDDFYTKPYSRVLLTYKDSADSNKEKIAYYDLTDWDDENFNENEWQVYEVNNNSVLQQFPITTAVAEQYAENIGQALKKVQYMPSDIKLKGQPQIEVGDTVEVMTNNDGFQTIVLRRTMQGIQSLVDNYESKGE